MKMTNREKKLFALMLFVLFGILYVQYLLLPLLALEQKTTLEKEILQDQYTKAKESLAMEKELDSQLVLYKEKTKTYLEKYFASANQEEILLLLNEFTKLEPELQSIKFSPVAIVSEEKSDFTVQPVSLKLQGTYASVVKLMQTLWNFQKQIGVNSVTLQNGGAGLISAEMNTAFYWVPNAPDHNDALVQWITDEAYYKADPFSPMEGDPARVNYIFIGGDESKLQNLFNKPFVDITGHWAEKEIEAFRQAGYVIADSENRFKPDEPMTRGEFIIMLDKIYQWPMPEGSVDLTKYTDYGTLGSYEGPIAKAIYKGYLGGYVIGFTDNTLRPRDPITYEEMEYVVSKVKNDPGFKWATAANRLQTEKGIVSNGLADPKAPMSRAEAVYLMTNFK